MKNKEQIRDEIAALVACKDYAPARTMFGEDNHAKIDAQIQALERGWDEDDARTLLEDEGAADYVIDAACEAIAWREGDADEIPSEGWSIYKPGKPKA